MAPSHTGVYFSFFLIGKTLKARGKQRRIRSVGFIFVAQTSVDRYKVTVTACTASTSNFIAKQ